MSVEAEVHGTTQTGNVAKSRLYNPQEAGRFGDVGLRVYSSPAELMKPKILPFLNVEYGNSMNQNGAFSGSAINVHDGIDSALWTGSQITGTKVTFNSTNIGTGWPPAGTKSVLVDNPAANDVWQFAKGSDQDLTNYSAFSMEVYIDKDWTAGDSVSIYGWNVSGAAIVGNKVLLENYINEADFDVAQSVSIPLVDMGLVGETISAFRMEQESKAGKAAKFYMDTLAIQETGGGIEYKISHDSTTRYCVNEFVITISDALAGTLANGAGMLPLSYDKILGVSSLSNGILLKSVNDGVVDFSASLSSITDFLAAGFKIENAMSDGTNTSVQLVQSFPDPLIVKGATDLNSISITISDDLTGLLKFSALLRGSELQK